MIEVLRVPRAAPTSYGSMLYYQRGRKKERMEFATDDEANEFADMLQEEERRIKE